MKKLILFLLFSPFIFAQKIQLVELSQSIKDKNKIAKSLTIIDYREDKAIGNVSHRKELMELKFEDENLSNLIQKWFSEDNKSVGSTDFIIIIDELKAHDEQKEKSVIGKLKIKMATFVKRNDKYYFIKRVNNSYQYEPKNHAYIPKAIASRISEEMSSLIKDSYSQPVTQYVITENELPNYEKVILGKIKALNSEILIDGVYTDYKSFFKQEINKDYSLKKNKDGKLTGVSNKNNYDTFSTDVFAIVDNGIAYRSTPLRLIEMQRDENGFFLMSSKEELYPQNTSTLTITGAAMGGVIGGVIGAVIDSSARKNNIKRAGLYRINIDSLTGDYIFSEKED